MPNVIQERRTLNNGPPAPHSLAEGQFAIEMGGVNPRLWVGTPTSLDPTGRRLVADVTRAYVDGQFAAVGSGTVRRITTGAGLMGGPITAEGEIALIVPLAVNLGGTGATDPAAAPFLAKAGGTMTGALLLAAAAPTDDRQAVSKLYVDTLVGSVTGAVRRITAGVGLTGGVITDTGTIALDVPVTVARGGTGATTAAGARANLGIPSGLALVEGAGISLTFGATATTIALATPVALADGGTGATDAATARANLGITGGPTPGVTDGSNAAPGLLGEYLTTGGVVTVNATTDPTDYQVLGTLNLTAGDWDVRANVHLTYTVTGGQQSLCVVCPSGYPLTASFAARPSDNAAWFDGFGVTQGVLAPTDGGTIGPLRVSSNAAAPMDFRVSVQGTSGTAEVDWTMSARRVR